MRFGLELRVVDGDDPLPGLTAQAQAAEEYGFDLVWLAEPAPGSTDLAAPLVGASALAGNTELIRVAAEVDAGPHPIYLAEEAIVADLSLGGRCTLVVRSADQDLLTETVEVLLAAVAARPFRHEGKRWRIPANLPENTVNVEHAVRVTPAPAQLELPIWVSGTAGSTVAARYCLPYVDADAATAADTWRRTSTPLGVAAARLRRPAVRLVDTDPAGNVDADRLVGALRAEQRGWGLDVLIVRLPDALSLDGRITAVRDLATKVRPRVQLDRLPPGLEDFWREHWQTADELAAEHRPSGEAGS